MYKKIRIKENSTKIIVVKSIVLIRFVIDSSVSVEDKLGISMEN